MGHIEVVLGIDSEKEDEYWVFPTNPSHEIGRITTSYFDNYYKPTHTSGNTNLNHPSLTQIGHVSIDRHSLLKHVPTRINNKRIFGK